MPPSQLLASAVSHVYSGSPPGSKVNTTVSMHTCTRCGADQRKVETVSYDTVAKQHSLGGVLYDDVGVI